jgi:hypothetical protein
MSRVEAACRNGSPANEGHGSRDGAEHAKARQPGEQELDVGTRGKSRQGSLAVGQDDVCRNLCEPPCEGVRATSRCQVSSDSAASCCI